MVQKLIQIGNSLGVIVRREDIVALGLKKGDKVKVDVVKAEGGNPGKSISPEFLEWVEKFNKEYGKSLQELAKR